MNKRMERVTMAREGLYKLHQELHDANLEDKDMILTLEDGKVFWVRGFKDKEAFEKEYKKGENK